MDLKANSSIPSGEQVTLSKNNSPDSPKPAFSPPTLRSIRFEMSAIFTVILAAILLVFSGVIYWILSTTVYTELDHDLKFQTQEITDNIHLYITAKKNEAGSFEYALKTTIAQGAKPRQRWWTTDFDRRWQRKIEQQDLTKVYVNFTTLAGQSLQTSSNMSQDMLALLKKNVRLPPSSRDDLYNINFNGRTIRMINSSFKGPEDQTYLLQVGIWQDPTIQLVGDWMNKVLLSIPVILFLTFFMGGLMAKRILRPMEKIAVLAQNITQEDLSKRVESEDFYEEMDPVIESFNGMIARLEKSFHHIRTFSSHIAHELKTPLTILRGETELALMSTRTPQEYQETLKTNLEEIQTMLKIIEDLLYFTRMEHHPGNFKFEAIDLVTYLREIREQGLILASEKNLVINCKMPPGANITVSGDPVHLKRLFFNLIQNAIKYSPSGGTIDIVVSAQEGKVIVRIIDYGRSIAPKDAEKIFDLFYSGEGGGNGMGLSIALALAKVHGGTITVADKPQRGAEFIVTLPTV